MINIFQHIPRTGGTTLISIFKNFYSEEEVFLYYGYRMTDLYYLPTNPKMIYGHLPFGIHKILDDDFLYIAMLRNPIERVQSLYRFVLAREGEIKFDGFLRSYDQNDVVKAFVYKPHTKQPSDWLDEAKENIAKHYLLGFTENYDAFLEELSLKFGWPSIPYEQKNASDKTYVFSKEEVDAIIDSNHLDMQLYSWARQKFLNKNL
jgi:hypothetical protein